MDRRLHGSTECLGSGGVGRPDLYPTATFQLKNGVVIWGGFDPISGGRDLLHYPSYLSGDIGVEADSTDNSYHVVTGSGTDSTAVLDGFVITGGYGAPAGPPNFLGSGMYNSYGSPTLVNLRFMRNGSPNSQGGGMYNFRSNPTLTKVDFAHNRANTGAGMYNVDSSPKLVVVHFEMNNREAMVNEGGSTPTLQDVGFWWNYDGAMVNHNSSPLLSNVSFYWNYAALAGAGMRNTDNSSPTLVNVTFKGNSAEDKGGGIYNFLLSSPVLVNVSFSANGAAYGGAIYNDMFSNPTLTNTILWGDGANTAGNEIYNAEMSMPVISYSIVEGCGERSPEGWDTSLGTDGGHNFDTDPLFVDAAFGDLRISSPRSWAVNNGNNAALPGGVATDLDGNPRIFAGTVDMGAYELQDPTGIESKGSPQPFRIVSVSPNPFNPSTTIRFTLPAAMPVTADISSVTGARVRVLANNQQFSPGDNELIWDGRNDQGASVASGVYFVRIETRLGARVTRAVLLK
jgi:hypothetical protein